MGESAVRASGDKMTTDNLAGEFGKADLGWRVWSLVHSICKASMAFPFVPTDSVSLWMPTQCLPKGKPLVLLPESFDIITV